MNTCKFLPEKIWILKQNGKRKSRGKYVIYPISVIIDDTNISASPVGTPLYYGYLETTSRHLIPLHQSDQGFSDTGALS